jgi:hypothetical protein
MPFRPALAIVLALVLAGPAVAGAQSASVSQSAQPVAHTSTPALSAAARQLLHLLELRVDDGAVELGSAAARWRRSWA